MSNQGSNLVPGLKDGYELIVDFLSENQLSSINSELMDVSFPDKAGGIRNAEKKYSSIRDIAASNELMAYVNKYLSGDANLVRAILFNKTSENNWLVTWHQDRTVTVSEKFEENGWGPWSIKDEVLHVQPPVSVLEQMVTFRIQLDDTCLENGCLKVLPNSHKLGILDPSAIKKYTQSHEAVACEAPAGSALVMRPHILHSSSKAIFPTQRRVLHLEYSSFKLPLGVSWA